MTYFGGFHQINGQKDDICIILGSSLMQIEDFGYWAMHIWE